MARGGGRSSSSFVAPSSSPSSTGICVSSSEDGGSAPLSASSVVSGRRGPFAARGTLRHLTSGTQDVLLVLRMGKRTPPRSSSCV